MGREVGPCWTISPSPRSCTWSHVLKTNHLSLVRERTAQRPLSSPAEIGQRDLGWVEFIKKRLPQKARFTGEIPTFCHLAWGLAVHLSLPVTLKQTTTCSACYCINKWSFILAGIQPRPIQPHHLLGSFKLEQRWGAAPKTLQLQSRKYLLSDPLQKTSLICPSGNQAP